MQISNDAAAVKKMALKTAEIIQKLQKNNKEIESELAALNTRWQDANYVNLRHVIEDKKQDLANLLKELEKFKQWLDQLQGRLYQWENAEQLK
jgi:DNA repair exonuclease SbcCD ATPase subunit